MRRGFIFAAAALALAAGRVRAQAPLLVPVDDPAYALVNRLTAAGVIDTVLTGQRPYTRQEFARLATQARRALSAAPPSLARDIDALYERFAAGAPPAKGWARVIDRISLAAASTNEQPRRVPPDTGIGGIDAFVAPLATEARPGGRDAMLGTTLELETRHEFAVGSHLSFEISPAFRVSADSSYARQPPVSLRALALRAQFANLLVVAGRDRFEWGIDRRGGALLSDNAPPLDAVRLSNAEPWVLPGFLRALGANSASIFLADLGARQVFPHARLAGYKWSIQPRRDLELGFSALDFVGGAGAPPSSFGARVKNLFLFPVLPTQGYQFSNTFAAFDMRWRPRWAGGAEGYWELTLDDFDHRRLRSSLWADDAAHVFGATLPAVGPEGRLALTAEYRHTGTRFGRHLQFTSGNTENGFLLGEPLGPDADGGYLYADWFAAAGARRAPSWRARRTGAISIISYSTRSR